MGPKYLPVPRAHQPARVGKHSPTSIGLRSLAHRHQKLYPVSNESPFPALSARMRHVIFIFTGVVKICDLNPKKTLRSATEKSVNNIAIRLGIYRKTNYLSFQSIYYIWWKSHHRGPQPILMRRSPPDKGDSAGFNMAAPMLVGARNEVGICSVISVRYENVKHVLHKGG